MRPQSHNHVQTDSGLRGGMKKLRQAKGRVRSNGPPAPDDLAQAHPGAVQSLGQFLLAQAPRLEKFLPQDISRWSGMPVAGQQGFLLPGISPIPEEKYRLFYTENLVSRNS